MTLRRASTICLLHDAPGLEVLMVRRPESARFMAGAWVFPGGAVDAEDWATDPGEVRSLSSDDHGWRAAGLRELAEEVGIWVTTTGTRVGAVSGDVYQSVRRDRLVLDARALVCFANWITPEPLPVRFDTRFFAAAVGREAVPLVDGREVVAATWIAPDAALERAARQEWLVAFPTRKTLELLADYPSSSSFLDYARSLSEVPAVQPRLRIDGADVAVVLPGDPGYAAAGIDEQDPSFMDRLAAAAAGPGDVAPELR